MKFSKKIDYWVNVSLSILNYLNIFKVKMIRKTTTKSTTKPEKNTSKQMQAIKKQNKKTPQKTPPKNQTIKNKTAAHHLKGHNHDFVHF